MMPINMARRRDRPTTPHSAEEESQEVSSSAASLMGCGVRSSPAAGPVSRLLAFGVDRILAGDFHRSSPPVPTEAVAPEAGLEHTIPKAAPVRPRFVFHHGAPAPSAAAAAAAARDGASPCAACVSSLLRCCRLGPGAGPAPPAGLPSPRPLRPCAAPHHRHHQHHHHMLLADASAAAASLALAPLATGAGVMAGAGGGSGAPSGAVAASGSAVGGARRKRSWSRAVFSNLQRKGLEKRFQLQKYITKPDRRQLAATLGLTDAQVKVWFQNRRMKWRHSHEGKAAAAAGAEAEGGGSGVGDGDAAAAPTSVAAEGAGVGTAVALADSAGADAAGVGPAAVPGASGDGGPDSTQQDDSGEPLDVEC